MQTSSICKRIHAISVGWAMPNYPSHRYRTGQKALPRYSGTALDQATAYANPKSATPVTHRSGQSPQSDTVGRTNIKPKWKILANPGYHRLGSIHLPEIKCLIRGGRPSLPDRRPTARRVELWPCLLHRNLRTTRFPRGPR